MSPSIPPELSFSLPSTANNILFTDDQGNIDTLDASFFQSSITSYLTDVQTYVDSELQRLGSASLNDITSAEVDSKIAAALDDQWQKICLPQMSMCKTDFMDVCHLCCSGKVWGEPFKGRCK